MHHRVIIPDNRGNARGNAHLVNASVRPVQLAAIITTSNGGWLGSFCQPPVGIVFGCNSRSVLTSENPVSMPICDSLHFTTLCELDGVAW